MNKKAYEKLCNLYQLLTLYYKLDIDKNLFKQFIWKLDKIHVEKILSPFFYEDYIFIDDKMMSDFSRNNDISYTRFSISKFWEKFSKFEKESIEIILLENKWKYVDNIDQLKLIDYVKDSDPMSHKESKKYYIDQIETYFFMTYHLGHEKNWNNYLKEIQIRKRDIDINSIIS